MRASRRAERIAVALWIVLAVVVWLVVFDRVLVLAGRQYVQSATIAARSSRPYLRADDWMRPAVARGVGTASFVAAIVLAIGLAAVSLAARRRSPEDLKSDVEGL